MIGELLARHPICAAVVIFKDAFARQSADDAIIAIQALMQFDILPLTIVIGRNILAASLITVSQRGRRPGLFLGYGDGVTISDIEFPLLLFNWIQLWGRLIGESCRSSGWGVLN